MIVVIAPWRISADPWRISGAPWGISIPFFALGPGDKGDKVRGGRVNQIKGEEEVEVLSIKEGKVGRRGSVAVERKEG